MISRLMCQTLNYITLGIMEKNNCVKDDLPLLKTDQIRRHVRSKPDDILQLLTTGTSFGIRVNA